MTILHDPDDEREGISGSIPVCFISYGRRLGTVLLDAREKMLGSLEGMAVL